MSNNQSKWYKLYWLPQISGAEQPDPPEPDPNDPPEPAPDPEPETVTLSKAEFEALKLANQNSRDLITAMQAGRTSPPPPPAKRFSPEEFNKIYTEDPYRAVSTLLDERDQNLRTEYMTVEQHKAAKEHFYDQYPDLRKYEALVWTIAREVETDMPNSTIGQKFAEIAQRTRQYLEELRGENGQRPGGGVPRVAGGRGARQPGAGNPPPKRPKSPEELAAAYLKSRSELREKRKHPGFAAQ